MDQYIAFRYRAQAAGNVLIFIAALVFVGGSILLGTVLSDLDRDGADPPFSSYASVVLFTGGPYVTATAVLGGIGIALRLFGEASYLRRLDTDEVLDALEPDEG